MYIRSSSWTVLNQGTVIMLLDVLIIQNLALYEVFRMLIQDKGETQDFRGCMNFVGLDFVYGIFLMYPAFLSLFVRPFLIKYPELLMVEGTGLLKFLFIFCSLLFSTWLSSFSSWRKDTRPTTFRQTYVWEDTLGTRKYRLTLQDDLKSSHLLHSSQLEL